jgi:hypothetical protein
MKTKSQWGTKRTGLESAARARDTEGSPRSTAKDRTAEPRHSRAERRRLTVEVCYMNEQWGWPISH